MAEVAKSGFLKGVSLFFEYDTPKIVHIRSKKVGITNRIIQAVILAYIIGYAIVYEKGYQEFEDVVSASTTKVKGTVFTHYSQLPLGDPRNNRIYDVADYVLPPQENDAFFVTTNIVMTQKQSQGKCPEDHTMSAAFCKTDEDCPAMEPIPNGNGVRTGSCVAPPEGKQKVCEIYAWCPVENDTLPLEGKTALLQDSRNFTVLIKNNIKFPKFNVSKRNILESQKSDYLKHCRYNTKNVSDLLCPIFELGTIVAEAGVDYNTIAVEGGVIDISIRWDCDLDHSLDDCTPEYSFSRLDLAMAKISPGWNFRYANYYEQNGTLMRDLNKAYGIRFVIKVTGRAGKFSLVPLLLSLGSGMGLLAVATVLCDIVVLYILKKGEFYKEKKYLYVTGDDAFQGFDSDDDSDIVRVEAPPTESESQPFLEDHTSYNSMEDTSQAAETVKKRNTGGSPGGDKDVLVD